jgi:hypothetical protein
MAAREQHRQRRVDRARLTGERGAVQISGKLQIDEQQGDLGMAVDQLETLLAGRGRDHRVAALLDPLRGQVSQHEIVLDDSDERPGLRHVAICWPAAPA